MPDQGIRRRQPVREEPRVRHDRAGDGRDDQRDRREGPAAGEARAFFWRHRDGHDDGDHHPRRVAQARQDRRGLPSAGGDAGRDDALHAHQLRHPVAHRQGDRARRHALGRRLQFAFGTLSLRAGRTERLHLDHDEPRESRALVAAVQGDGEGGSDRGSALRHAGGAGEERSRGGRDDRCLDETAHQARGDEAGRRREHSRRRGARYDGAPERAELRDARHHAGDAAQDSPRQDAVLAGAHQRQAADGEVIAGSRRAHFGSAEELARARLR